jgi:hypothetical protein
VIEGYSVDEAASVLGVPKGRVWELLARGILAGTPEDGGGMRVYLQGRPMEPIVGRPPEGRPAGSDDRRGPNGNGGEHGQPGFEASPFRELLTEFRNLTERYGQALLALGESRGEVASLRTRVELLEARVDLRLPSAPPLVQWSPPAQAPAYPEPVLEPEPEPIAEPMPSLDEDAGEPVQSTAPEQPVAEPSVPLADDEPVAKTARARRRRRARSATEGFAEALARAQDPTVSDLPGGEEAQAALNELRERIRRESHVADSEEAVTPAVEEPVPAPVEEPAEASLEEPGETMGYGTGTALAPEIELDPFLADEELGRGVEAVAVEAVRVDAAEVSQVPEAEMAEMREPTEPDPEIDEPEIVQSSDSDEPLEGSAPADMVERSESVEQPEAVEASAEEPPMSAEPEPVEAAAHAYSHEWDEPDWIAEEDVDWDSDQPAPPPEPVAMGESPEIGWDELPAAMAPATSEPASETANAEALIEGGEGDSEPAVPESAADYADQEDAQPPAEPSTPQPIAVDARSSTPPLPPPAPAVDDSPSGTRDDDATSGQAPEEELMWLGDEFRAGPSSWGSPGRSTTLPKPATSAAADVGVSPAEDEALSRMAVERGWDDDELRAIRSLLAQPGRIGFEEAEATSAPGSAPHTAPDRAEPPAASAEPELREEEAFDWEQGPPAWNPPPMARASRELPGAVELDQAMAAFEVGAWSKESAEHRDEPIAQPPAPEPRDQVEPKVASPPQSTSPIPPPVAPASSTSARTEPTNAGETDWLRGRRGPAANAYRRLRRLFP